MRYLVYSFIFVLFFTEASAQYNIQNNFHFSDKPKSENLDVKIFRAINGLQNNVADVVLPYTDRSIIPIAIATPPLMFFLARNNDNTYDENSAVLLGLSEATTFLITFGLKTTIKRDRPYVTLKKVYFDTNASLVDPYSFPSGHTSTSFAFATSLSLRYSDKPFLVTGLYTYAMIVSLGRIYFGVHYPSDVLAGMVIGAGSSLFFHSIRKEIFKAKNNLLGESKEDKNKTSESIAIGITFGSFVAADLINKFLSGTNNKILKSTKLSVTGNGLNLNYSF